MTKHIYIKEYQSPMGHLIIGDYCGEICLCDWKYRKQRNQIDQRIQKITNRQYEESNTEVIDKCINQLQEYFKGNRKNFDLNLALFGSDFQQRVWRALLQIPYGMTISYLKLSRELGDEKAIRAVATANGANAISILIPCHRVIGSDGALTGYAGGLRTKRRLLDIEGTLINNQVKLDF